MKTFCQFSILSLSLLVLALNTISSPVGAKVEPPNYNFSLDKFDLFFPGSKQSEIKKQYSNETLVLSHGNFKTYKYYVEHIRYKFAILVQYKDGVVTDFHARLPPYFLHDVFHQSLINRYGKQDIYKNEKEQSLYIWNNEKNFKHYYSGACSVTCFPIYYAVRKIDTNNLGSYKTVLEQLNESENKTKQPQPNGAEI